MPTNRKFSRSKSERQKEVKSSIKILTKLHLTTSIERLKRWKQKAAVTARVAAKEEMLMNLTNTNHQVIETETTIQRDMAREIEIEMIKIDINIDTVIVTRIETEIEKGKDLQKEIERKEKTREMTRREKEIETQQVVDREETKERTEKGKEIVKGRAPRGKEKTKKEQHLSNM